MFSYICGINQLKTTIMTPALKLVAFILGFLFVVFITSILTIKLTYVDPVKPTYTAQDSIEMEANKHKSDSLQSELKKTYSIARKSIKESSDLRKSNTTLRNKLNDLLNDKSATCEDKLTVSVKLNDSLTFECLKKDTAIDALDLEARQYSDLLLISKNNEKLQIKRNKALSFQMDSCIDLYSDSITAILKQSDKAIKKEKSKTLFYKITTTVAAALGIYGSLR